MRMFGKDLKKVEKWAKDNDVNIYRMKDSYLYGIITDNETKYIGTEKTTSGLIKFFYLVDGDKKFNR